MKLGERIKKARENAKLSQDELAKSLNIGKRTLIDYEKGVSEPKASTLMSIANICNVDANWLLTGKGSMFSDTSPHNTPPKLDKEFEVICEYLKDLDRSKRKKVLKYILELSDNGDE